jgi:type II secretory pathway pseudopilin PulG
MELILVLVIITIVLAIATPSLRGFFAGRQTADASLTMLSLTKWAQTQAISQGCPCRVNVDTRSGEYWLTVQEAGTYQPLKSSMGRRFQVPKGVTISVLSDSSSSNSSFAGSGGSGLSQSPLGGSMGRTIGQAYAQAATPTISHVQFYPSGRSDVAVIEIAGKDGEVIRLTCGSATEPFRIAAASEGP